MAQLFDLLNHERSNKNLPLLKWCPELTTLAFNHTMDMALVGQIFHTSPTTKKNVGDRAADFGLRYICIGENVSYGNKTFFKWKFSGYDGRIIHQHNGYMGSPPHRQAILSTDYERVGVAVLDDFTNRTHRNLIYTCQVFAR